MWGAMKITETGKGDDSDHNDQQSRAGLDPAAQALIGAQLKAMYAEICDEPVPSHLLDLVKKFERVEEEK